MCYSKCGSRLSAAHIRFNNLQQFHGSRGCVTQNVALDLAPRTFVLTICNILARSLFGGKCLGFEYQKRIDSIIFLPFGLRGLFGTKNRIREECQKCLGFEYQTHIDYIIFLPFGLRSFFGAKNRIREGCQKCIGL